MPAKTKDVATANFRHFLKFFECRFNCRGHVLRTDGGGGEYKPLDEFCKDTGVTRQISGREIQARNGKAERMHRKNMNMVRSMIFGSGLPINLWVMPPSMQIHAQPKSDQGQRLQDIFG